MTHFQWHRFSELSLKQLYSLMALRAETFVVEQHCHYLDLDGRDYTALHLLGSENDNIVTYLRLFLPTGKDQPLTFGRVVTAKAVRKKGYGKQLISELLNYCDTHFPAIPIECSSQYAIKEFYETFGFKTYGEVYDDVGILHIAMRKDFDKL